MVPVSYRSSSGTPSGLANPLFQEGGRTRPGRRQLSSRDIGQPSLVSSTAAPRPARAQSPVLSLQPSAPGPQVTPRSPPGWPPQVPRPPQRPPPTRAGRTRGVAQAGGLGRPFLCSLPRSGSLPVPR